jgi:hypothetical protein
MTYCELFGPFFPYAFLALPVVRPAPRWDEVDDTWLAGELGAGELLALDEGEERIDPCELD